MLTLRPAWPRSNTNDWSVFDDGETVGRIYEDRAAHPGATPKDCRASQPITPQRITKRTVDALKANFGEFTMWDDAVTGFGVRVRPVRRQRF
jgi:hypothetical protein